jgi:hypothetical protein
VAGDDKGNRVLATVTRLAWAGGSAQRRPTASHGVVRASARTDERKTVTRYDPENPSGPPTAFASTPRPDPKPDLDAGTTAGYVWRSPTADAGRGCVQVAALDGGVLVRDSADPTKMLVFSTLQFAAFCEGVCAGDYRDLLPSII